MDRVLADVGLCKLSKRGRKRELEDARHRGREYPSQR
jgi:hypothetical protein